MDDVTWNIKKVNFQPGDRVLVQVPDTLLNGVESQSIHESIQRWAGDVPVLIYPHSITIDVINSGPQLPWDC